MSLVLMAVLGAGVWALAYGPIVPLTASAAERLEPAADLSSLALQAWDVADPAEAAGDAAAGNKSLTTRPGFG